MPRNNRKHPVASVDRLVRVNELLKRVLADLLETLGYNEEQGKIISITRVDCASNLKTAAVYVSIRGAKYPLADARISSAFPIGVSNEWAEDEAVVTVHEGTILIVESRL